MPFCTATQVGIDSWGLTCDRGPMPPLFAVWSSLRACGPPLAFLLPAGLSPGDVQVAQCVASPPGEFREFYYDPWTGKAHC